jgi:hypothetical protein
MDAWGLVGLKFATLKQEKGVPIPRHALLSANRHDGERMASPVPFALRFTPQRGTSPVACGTRAEV